ncbi:MAG: selenocysteine-specific translation elongation factor [Planctomycetota bacterium]|nr:selenocysteine-specific translation elongation factor [Planctomycetota bacterium]
MSSSTPHDNSEITPTCALILGTAGHIDHGKTALIGALTGTNTDRLPEEQKRGITIELGFAQLDLPPYKLGIVDVPGHEKFVRNMLAGATGLDIAMLVVAADDSVKPQTVEHLEILRYLNLSAGLIVLTKCDLAEPDLLALVEEEVRETCQNTFLQDAPIIRTSAITGEGIEELKQQLQKLCQHVANTLPATPSDMFRLAIDRSFSLEGHGTVVTGSVTSGQLSVDDHVHLEPGGLPLRVRSLQNHDQSVNQIVRGERAAINLAGIKPENIHRGMELATSGFLQPHQRLSVSLTVSPTARLPLKNHSRNQLHIGTANVALSVKLLTTDVLHPGETGLAQLALDEPVVCTWNQPFVLRLESPVITIAGGHILQPEANQISFGDAESNQFLQQLSAANSPLERVEAAIFLRGLPPRSAQHLERTAGVPDYQKAVEKLLQSETVLQLDHTASQPQLVHSASLRRAWKQVERILQKEHEKYPLRTSLSIAPLRNRLNYLGNDTEINRMLSYFQKQGHVQIHDGTVALKGQGPRLTKNERKLLGNTVDQIKQDGLNTLLVKEIEAQAGSLKDSVQQLLHVAVANGDLVEISEQYFVHTLTIEQVQQQLTTKLDPEESYTMSEIRNHLQTTRKYAVPLCEYFDRIGFTVRDGDQRHLNK